MDVVSCGLVVVGWDPGEIAYAFHGTGLVVGWEGDNGEKIGDDRGNSFTGCLLHTG